MTNNKQTNIIEFARNENKTKTYNNKIGNKTSYYQKKFGFETSPQQGHEFWNNEADAFKHAFMSADLFFQFGDLKSLIAGMYHEYQTPNNPPREWNMDSWNNNQGREIAKEILKEYGKNFLELPKQKQDDIIATKVMYRMRNGQLITKPTDTRDYNGSIENLLNKYPEMVKFFSKNFRINTPTGQAAPIENMSLEMQPQTSKSNLSGYTNPLTGNNRIFTREDVGVMTPEEFAKYEKEIDAQTEFFNGTMPTNEDLQREAFINGEVIYVNSYTRADGTYVKGYYRTK